ncbi:hypothetical protein Tco_0163530 [Tanacetum coccineum]
MISIVPGLVRCCCKDVHLKAGISLTYIVPGLGDLVTHQGNSQVKDCKIDLLVLQYEKFSIPDEETIDNSFTRFTTFVTSLKSLDLIFSNKNHVRKYLRALPTKWRGMNDMLASKDKKENVKSLALKAKVTSDPTSDDDESQGGSDKDNECELNDEECNLMAKNLRRFFRRGGNLGEVIGLVAEMMEETSLEEIVGSTIRLVKAQGANKDAITAKTRITL